MATIQNLNFLPTSIPGCQLWLDASDPSTVITTGTSITQWNDKSGNGNTAVAGTLTYPIYSPSSLNNLNTIQLRSSNDYFRVSNNFTYSTYPYFNIFVVFQANNTSQPANAGIVATDTPGAYGRSLGLSGNSFNQEYYNGFTNITTFTASTWYVTGLLFSSNVSSTLYVNGTGFAATTSGAGTNTIGLHIGVQNPSSSYTQFNANIDLGEIIIITSNITGAQRQQIEGYLAWKWNLQGNLPSTHPYKLIAPNSRSLTYPSQISIPVSSQSLLPSTAPIVFFDPRSIPGLVLWLDAADAGSVVRSGSTVTAWNDKSGLRYVGTSTAGRNFTYATNVKNGLNAVQTATGQTLLIPNFVLGTTMSIFFLYYPINQSSSSPFIELGPDTNSSPGFYLNSSGNHNFLINNSGNLTLVNIGNVTVSNSWQILEGINKDPNASNTMAFYTDGTQRATGGNTTTNVTVTNTLYINGRNNGNTLSVASYIAELLIFNTALTNIQRQQIEGYLGWKWGVTSSLPASNPFKTVVPGPQNISISFFGMLAASFTPRSIAGLQLWLDGQDPLNTGTAPANGDLVSTWFDKSGGSRNFTASGTAAAYSSAQQALNFTTNLYTSSFSANVVNESLFFVFNASQTGIAIGTSSSGGRSIGIYSSTQVGVINGMVAWGAITPVNTISLNTRFFGTALISGGTSTQIAVNGSTSFASATVPAFSGGNTQLGREGASTLQYAGFIYEIISYPSVLSTGQRQAVEGYLAWKWNLVGSLPATHLFKNYPPPP